MLRSVVGSQNENSGSSRLAFPAKQADNVFLIADLPCRQLAADGTAFLTCHNLKILSQKRWDVRS
jgi:hypothetical protein